MKPLTQILALALIFSFTIVSCSNDDDGIYFDETNEIINVENVTYTEIETEILTLVNSYRKSINLSELSPLNIVSSVADGHTKYMIENDQISHDNFDKRSQSLMANAGAKSVAENVAYGYTSAESALQGWLNSDSHRSVIENPHFTHFGISTEQNSNGRNFFTHIFIKK